MIQFAGGDASDESHPGTFHDRAGLNDPSHFSRLMIHVFLLNYCVQDTGYEDDDEHEVEGALLILILVLDITLFTLFHATRRSMAHPECAGSCTARTVFFR